MQLKNNLVRTFCEDQKGNLWIGTMSGVDRLGTDRLCRTDELGALGESSVWSLRADNQGGIWVGTFYDGIYYCNSDNYPFNPILLPAERKVKLINAMVEDILAAYPAGQVPDPRKFSLRPYEEIEPCLREPLSEGWKSVHELPRRGLFVES